MCSPPPRMFISLGDSITSGHHGPYILRGRRIAAACNDPNYSYAGQLYNMLKPTRPGLTPNYLAYSGYSTFETMHGGLDACAASHAAPLPTAVALLTAHKNRGNIVVISDGVDDTGWSTVLLKLAAGGVNDAACEAIISPWENGTLARALPAVTANTNTILTTLEKADRGGTRPVHIYWLSYYNFSGTGPLDGYRCEKQLQRAISRIHIAIKAGLIAADRRRVQWTWEDIDTGPLMHENDPHTQTLLAHHFLHQTYGWPHPNSNGHAAIARDLLPKIIP